MWVLAVLACATAELRPDADDPQLRPWMIAADPAEAIAVLKPALAERDAWEITRLTPSQGYAELVHYSARMRFADDVVVRAYARPEADSTIVRAFSRSRIGVFDFGQNRKNLQDLMDAWAAELKRRGINAAPVGLETAP